MKDTNYIMLIGWMFNQLKLNPNYAAVYGLIYGFSQDGATVYRGSINYISRTTNLSRNTIITILKSLENRGFIIKKQVVVNNVKFNEYAANLDIIKGGAKIALPSPKIGGGSAKIGALGSAKIAPNNTNNNNNLDSGARAFDFFKINSPIQFEQWLMHYQKTIKNFVKFIQDFNDKYDLEGREYSVKPIKARLSIFARNWAVIEAQEADKIKVEPIQQYRKNGI